MPVIVQVGLGLLTIAGSGIMSGVVTHKLNVTKEREEFLRGKLEDLFEAVGGFQDLFGECMMIWLRFTNDEFTFEEAHKLHGEVLDGKPEYYATAEMLINLYFRALLPEFQACRRAADNVTAIQLKLRRLADGPKANILILYNPLHEAITEFHKNLIALKGAILERGASLKLLQAKGPKE
jgi:hypothetical protein